MEQRGGSGCPEQLQGCRDAGRQGWHGSHQGSAETSQNRARRPEGERPWQTIPGHPLAGHLVPCSAGISPAAVCTEHCASLLFPLHLCSNSSHTRYSSSIHSQGFQFVLIQHGKICHSLFFVVFSPPYSHERCISGFYFGSKAIQQNDCVGNVSLRPKNYPKVMDIGSKKNISIIYGCSHTGCQICAF